MADEFLLAGNAQVPGRGSGGDDDCLGLETLRSPFQQEGPIRAALNRFNTCPSDLSTEFLGLRLHFHHQIRPHDSIWVTWKILHLGGGCKLAARLSAGNKERREIGASGVNGRSVSCAAGADDDDIFHKLMII